MKALILVGGYGTRLRPLTLSVPKPLIKFCNKPTIEYQIQGLKKAGVDEFILAVAYQPSVMIEALQELEQRYKVKIRCSREDEPLGTAGPIRLAKSLLLGCTNSSKDSKNSNSDCSSKSVDEASSTDKSSPTISGSSANASTCTVKTTAEEGCGSYSINSFLSTPTNSSSNDSPSGGANAPIEFAASDTATPILPAADCLAEKKEIQPVWNGKDVEDCFFVCNSDIICSFPLQEMLQFHKQRDAEATILVTEVADPSSYGVVQHDEDGRVHAFVEKPQQYVGNCINAGLYILNNSVIDRIPLRPSSIETDVFPQMAPRKRLFCFKLNGYWADIGQPKDFLMGTQLHLEQLRQQQLLLQHPLQQQQQVLQQKQLQGIKVLDATTAASADGVCKRVRKQEVLEQQHVQKQGQQGSGDDKTEQSSLEELAYADAPQFIGNVLIDPSVQIGAGSVIGPDVTIDRNVIIGRGCRVQRTALMEGVRVGDYSWIQRTIVGWQSRIGRWCRVEGLTVVGENVQIANECCINGSFVLPHKLITKSIHLPGTIIM